ncbi:MAG: sulfatase [Planctomycetes bacterium]|nr:sulfatase [Planctomycetota bacterium]
MNLVFILADDLRWNALGCMGDPIIRTPNLDRLAGQGIVFSNCFVTTSICAVSRASLFSGQYARRHGINDFSTPFPARAWAQTYPALLRKAGYRTGFIGKFGVGRDVKPMAAEFDYWRGLPGQAGPFFDAKDPSHTHATARFGEQALEFLRGGEPGKPFCLSISFSAPHARDGDRREFPPDRHDEKLYAGVTIPVPKTADEKHFRLLPRFVQESEGRTRWKRRFATPKMFQETVRDYYRLISGIDREVGRIIETLREQKFAADTLLVFTSDNGFFLGERGMADKWLPYEESIRVPLIVFDPRLPQAERGRKVARMALNIDLAPTLFDYGGVKVPKGMQGQSLRPLVRGQRPQWRTEWFYEHHTLPKIIPPSEAVRTERWKYIRWDGVDPAIEELYDLEKDPQEEHNLATQPGHAKTVRQLRERWSRLRKELE